MYSIGPSRQRTANKYYSNPMKLVDLNVQFFFFHQHYLPLTRFRKIMAINKLSLGN